MELCSLEGRSPKCGRSSIFGTRWNPLFSIFKSWNKREDLCRDHPDSAACDIGSNRCPGRSLSSFLIQLFSYMVKRRVLTAPSGQYRLKRNRRIRKQQKKRCRREHKKRKKEGGRDRKRSRRTEEKTEGGEEIRETRKKGKTAAGA